MMMKNNNSHIKKDDLLQLTFLGSCQGAGQTWAKYGPYEANKNLIFYMTYWSITEVVWLNLMTGELRLKVTQL